MATTTADISPDEYLTVTNFIVNKVREESRLEGDHFIGVRWKSLREWITDQISDEDRINDEDYFGEQKTLATAVLKRMAHV
jgi:hypothetical protein